MLKQQVSQSKTFNKIYQKEIISAIKQSFYLVSVNIVETKNRLAYQIRSRIYELWSCEIKLQSYSESQA